MWGRLRRRRAADRTPELVVVTRVGCHLCEEMLTAVRSELGPERGPELDSSDPGRGADAGVRTLDVDAAVASGEITQEQHARWSTLVPVLLVDGHEVAHYRVEPGLVSGLVSARPSRKGGARDGRFGGSAHPNIE